MSSSDLAVDRPSCADKPQLSSELATSQKPSISVSLPASGSAPADADGSRRQAGANEDAFAAVAAADSNESHLRNGSRSNQVDPTSDQQSGGDIEQVRDAFVALIRYNTVQYFYITALLYSVMIIGFIILHSSAMMGSSDWAHNEPNALNIRQSNGKSNNLLVLVPNNTLALRLRRRRRSLTPTRRTFCTSLQTERIDSATSNCTTFEPVSSVAASKFAARSRPQTEAKSNRKQSSFTPQRTQTGRRLSKSVRKRLRKQRIMQSRLDGRLARSMRRPEVEAALRGQRKRTQRNLQTTEAAATKVVSEKPKPTYRSEEGPKKCPSGSDMSKSVGWDLARMLMFVELSLALLLASVFALTLFKFGSVNAVATASAAVGLVQMQRQQKHRKPLTPSASKSTGSGCCGRYSTGKAQTDEPRVEVRELVSSLGRLLVQTLLHLPLAALQIGAIMCAANLSSNNLRNNHSAASGLLQNPMAISRDTTPSLEIISRATYPPTLAHGRLDGFAGNLLRQSTGFGLRREANDDDDDEGPRPSSSSNGKGPQAEVRWANANGLSDLFCARSHLRLPVCALLVLAYISPTLFDASPLSVKLFAAMLTMSPYLFWIWLASTSSSLHEGGGTPAAAFDDFRSQPRPMQDEAADFRRRISDSEIYLELFCIALALLLGAIKRKRWMSCVSDRTFRGATRLIDAKVSLEQQRQQQETLLLSVLPAYVAEQVKRNMVKKIIGESSAASDSAAAAAASTMQTNIQQQQHPSTATTDHLANTAASNSYAATNEEESSTRAASFGGATDLPVQSASHAANVDTSCTLVYAKSNSNHNEQQQRCSILADRSKHSLVNIFRPSNNSVGAFLHKFTRRSKLARKQSKSSKQTDLHQQPNAPVHYFAQQPPIQSNSSEARRFKSRLQSSHSYQNGSTQQQSTQQTQQTRAQITSQTSGAVSTVLVSANDDYGNANNDLVDDENCSNATNSAEISSAPRAHSGAALATTTSGPKDEASSNNNGSHHRQVAQTLVSVKTTTTTLMKPRTRSSHSSSQVHKTHLTPAHSKRQGQTSGPIVASASSIGLRTQATNGSHCHDNGSSAAQVFCPNSNQQQLSCSSNLALTQSARRGFNELYIRTYNNVSLLYGDIVGFTRLCTQLSSSQLVRILNDLFSYFDHLAERHRIMRIKILGDCYYGVSGIPEFAVMGAKSRASRNENHAINCVNMGLDMIDYIKCLNVERTSSMRSKTTTAATNHSKLDHPVFTAKEPQQQSPLPVFELNMRIGVHSGHIHSGVIGLKKWQFDVWSNDVSIAMHCESSGVAGRVQVTDATVQQLQGAFTFEPSPGAQRDLFLADKDIKTYLIRDLARTNLSTSAGASNNPSLSTSSSFRRQVATPMPLDNDNIGGSHKSFAAAASLNHHRLGRASSSAMNELDDEKIRVATVDTISQTLLAREPIGSRGLNSYALALDHQDFYPISLNYRDQAIEKLYAHRSRSLGLHCLELASMVMLLFVVLPQLELNLYGTAFFFLFINLFKTSAWILMTLLAVFVVAILYFLGIVLQFTQPTTTTTKTATTTDPNCPITTQTATRESPSIVSISDAALRSTPVESALSMSRPLTTTKLGQRLLDSSAMRYLRRRRRFFSSASSRLVSFCNENRFLVKFIHFTALAIVILFQVYLFTQKVCPSELNNNPYQSLGSPETSGIDTTVNNISSSSKTTILTAAATTTTTASVASKNLEHFQLSVIFLLMVLDLSMDLLEYRSKLMILLLILMAQIVVLANPLSLAAAATSSSSSSSFPFPFPLTPFDGCATTSAASNGNHLKLHPTQSTQTKVPTTTTTTTTRGTGALPSSSPTTTFTYQRATEWSTDALILLMALWCIAYARQLEYIQRVNFLWRNRLNVDHEELEYISGINKVLLENILPSHVVRHYMTHSTEHPKPITLPSYMRMSISNMRSLGDELYHEQHDSVAVMFASIPHFYEFYDESDISKQGLGCIALLNEIICDFDKLLLKNKFSRIEKIKTIGSTYMAAAGLRPCHLNSRSSNASQASQGSCPTQFYGSKTPTGKHHAQSLLECPNSASGADDRRIALSQQKLNLICMIQFATSLMAALNGINKQSFQVFKLKIGVNTGSVIAGIIGAQRPFYDIWGDCVNIASRMESLGEVGRIQVEEKTAKLLMDCLCLETYSIVKRGSIDVKGKGGMVTYFVDKRPMHSTTGGDNVD